MLSFRDFVEADMAAAPSMGSPAPTAPGQGGDTPKGRNDMRVGWREFGIDDEDGEEALKHGEPIMSHSPLDDPNSPIKASGPMPITYDDEDHGTILYKAMNRAKFQNPNGSKYHGDVRNRKVFLGKRDYKNRQNPTWDDIVLEPHIKQQQQGGMPPAPPGGGMPPPPGGM